MVVFRDGPSLDGLCILNPRSILFWRPCKIKKGKLLTKSGETLDKSLGSSLWRGDVSESCKGAWKPCNSEQPELDVEFLLPWYVKPRNEPKLLWNKIKKEEDKSWGFLNFSSSAVNYNFIKDIRKKAALQKEDTKDLEFQEPSRIKRIKEEWRGLFGFVWLWPWWD